MPPIDESPSFEPKPPAPETRKSKTAPAATQQPSSPNLVSLTIEAATGRIVKVEGIDAAGARRKLPEDERNRLSGTVDQATLQRLVEQAFEAGIACVLGERAGEEEPAESDDD